MGKKIPKGEKKTVRMVSFLKLFITKVITRPPRRQKKATEQINFGVIRF